jgi:hypothetical protein
MAEPDSGRPAPSGAPDPARKPRQRATLASVMRQMERANAPILAEMERVEDFTRRVHAAMGLGDGEDPGQPGAAASAETAPPPPPPPLPPPRSPRPERPRFEIDPPARLMAALRQAFPGFKPTDRWWIHVEAEVKNIHHRSSPADHDAFCLAFLNWGPDDLLRYLESEGLIQKSPRQRGPTVCERLRDLHREDPDFTETAPERAVAKRIGRSTGALSKSHYWTTVLKPKRAEVRAQKSRVRSAQRWGHFDTVGRRDEEAEGH